MKKTLLLAVAAIFLTLGLHAQSKQWCMVDPVSQIKVPMSQVGFLLASDNDDTFSIVCNNGLVYNNVAKVEFQQLDAQGISTPESAESMVTFRHGATAIRVLGCPAGTVVGIYSASGQQVGQYTLSGSDSLVPIDGLVDGVYVIRAGKTAVKFVKK